MMCSYLLHVGGQWLCCCHDSAAPVSPVFFFWFGTCFCCCFLTDLSASGAWGVPVFSVAISAGCGIVMGLNSGGYYWISVSYLTLFRFVSLVGLL